jgi:hypothetical protein
MATAAEPIYDKQEPPRTIEAALLLGERAVHGFQRYIRRKGRLIPNYAQRRRAGQPISTGFGVARQRPPQQAPCQEAIDAVDA